MPKKNTGTSSKSGKSPKAPKAPQRSQPLTDAELESTTGGVHDAASGQATGRRSYKPVR
jgi:hypothetical protein